MALPMRPEWHQFAICKGLTSLFYDELAVTRAKMMCAVCPAQAPCRTAGMAEKWGVWGGLSARQRGKERRDSTVTHTVEA